jgi:uncharacterized protein YcbK (DUF882 family)
LFLLGAAGELQNAVADSDTRTLSFHHVHTGENITITIKRNGRYDPAAPKKLDWFMRDWRKEKSTQMDPHLFDVLWKVYHEVGATQPIQIICGYRSPATNAMLRKTSSGVARYSQHTTGHAIDFFIPGVPLAKLRAVGLKLQRGGVGFYPKSGSPFVHMDTGSIRHWPGISRAQLAKIFPNGRTVHIPSDGKPMRNFALALADVERQGNAPNDLTLERARAAGAITQHDVMVARADRGHPVSEHRSLLADLFGGNAEPDADEDQAEQVASAAPASAQAPARALVARLSPVPLPVARPATTTLAAAKSAPAATEVASAESIFDERGYWTGAVNNGVLPAANMLPGTTGSLGTGALAYAVENGPEVNPASTPAEPMGARLIAATGANTSVIAKSALPATMAIGGQRLGSPWLRAAMLTPSVAYSMRTTRLGAIDPHWLHTLLRKPAQALAMTFSNDPNQGMSAGHFSGNAIVFLATTSFVSPQMASLQ